MPNEARYLEAGLLAGRIEAARQMGAASDSRLESLEDDLRNSLAALGITAPTMSDFSAVDRRIRDSVNTSTAAWFGIGYDVILLQAHLRLYSMLAIKNPIGVQTAFDAAVPMFAALSKQLRIHLAENSAPETVASFVDRVCEIASNRERLRNEASSLFEQCEAVVIRLRKHVQELSGPARSSGSIQHSDFADVFLSYSTHDKQIADEIAACIRSHGFSVFLAHQTITIGPKWEDQVADAARSCRIAVLLLSQHSRNSDWVRYEIGALWALGKPVAPGLIALRSSDVPALVGKYQSRPVTTAEEQRAFCREVCRYLSAQQSGEPEPPITRVLKS